MSFSPLDPIVIGHNVFFGVDHLSSERGKAREAHFGNISNIIQVVEWSVDRGASGIMLSTHERATEIIGALKQHPKLIQKLRFYPLLPYVQKYVVAANEKGLLNVITDTLADSNTSERLALIWQGAKALFAKDIYSVLSGLISVELRIFRGLNVGCIFLHDAFTDLALALEMKGIFEFYHEEIERVFKTKAAFATKNLPALLKKFKTWGFEPPIVMAHVNKVGFNMNPSQKECEFALRDYRQHVMAMNTLAGGYLNPNTAFDYIAQFPQIESVVVGASSLKHIDETFSAIKKMRQIEFSADKKIRQKEASPF